MCSICMNELTSPVRTPCGHVYCRPCLRTWFGRARVKTCPMDRSVVAWEDVVPVL
jgi:hypothetical protein